MNAFSPYSIILFCWVVRAMSENAFPELCFIIILHDHSGEQISLKEFAGIQPSGSLWPHAQVSRNLLEINMLFRVVKSTCLLVALFIFP